MLSQKYPEAKLADLLLDRDGWRPFPSASERDAWQGLPEVIRAKHISDGERYLDHDWPTVLATRFLDYVRDGDRDRMQRVSFGRRSALVALTLADCTEGAGRFTDDIVNGVWAICEETYWGVSAHIGVQKAGAGLPGRGGTHRGPLRGGDVRAARVGGLLVGRPTGGGVSVSHRARDG